MSIVSPAAALEAVIIRLRSAPDLQALLGDPARIYLEEEASMVRPAFVLDRIATRIEPGPGPQLAEHEIVFSLHLRKGATDLHLSLIAASQAAIHAGPLAIEDGVDLGAEAELAQEGRRPALRILLQVRERGPGA